MTEILSKAEFARRVGVTRGAVSKWVDRGKLTAPALLTDGRVDLDAARAQLALKVDPLMAARTLPTLRVAALAPAVPTADQVSASQLLRARAIVASVDAERARRELNLERGRYVLADAVSAEWAQALAGFLQDLEIGLTDLASDAGLTRPQLIAARAWLRDRRARAAKAFAEAAATEAEYVGEVAA